jgi:membrane peptidoglycan carboxypeptidase
VTPRELAQIYATLASGGTRPAVHGLNAVVQRSGEPIAGHEVPEARRVLQAQPAYLVTSVLQGVLDRGTAAGARSQGVRGELAGKTGTTNGRRDNWFAGYSPDRVTVVWVGYDDNAKSRLSGSSAALPIWSRFVRAMRPAGGWPAFVQPAGIVKATVDPTTGQLATAACPYAVTDLFPEEKAPMEPCTQHPQDGGGAWQSASLAPENGQGAVQGAALTGTIPGAAAVEVTPGGRPAPAEEPGEARPGTILIRRSRGARAPEIGVRPADPAPGTEDGEGEGGVLSGQGDAEDWTGPIGQTAPPPPPATAN